jgi:Protein kinase domain
MARPASSRRGRSGVKEHLGLAQRARGWNTRPVRADPRIGTELAGHRIERIIGQSRSSIVYLAEHIRLGRKVALKLLDPQLSENAAFRERFIRESRVAAELDDPNIVTVYDAGEVEGMLYLSMRFVEGTDLARLLREEGRLEPARTVEIVAQIASALDVAHAHGLVHRDVKPANILLRQGPAGTDRAYLSDFGITRRVSSGSGVTISGEFVGTVDYVAPEQIRGELVDARTDVYSLSCVAFECLAGEPPFPRDTDVAVIYAHLDDQPPRLSEHRPGLPADLDDVLVRGMAKAKEERFPTCGGFATALRAALGVPRPAVAARSSRARPRRTRGWIVAGAAAVLVLAAALIAIVVSGRETGAPPATRPSTPPTTPSGSAAPPASELAWVAVPRQLELFGGPGDQTMSRATVTQDGVVAVGYWVSSSGNYDAAAWTSQDGKSWQRVSSPSFEGLGNQWARGVARLRSLVVAVGSSGPSGDLDAAVWRSADAGQTWSKVDTGLSAIGDQVMRRVAKTDSGLVAVGYDTSGGDSDVSVWTSPDGRHWAQVSAGVFKGAGNQEARTIAESGTTMVIAGSSITDGEVDAAVWRSKKGAWVRSHALALRGPGDQVVDEVIAGGPGFIAVGYDSSGGDMDGAIWTSTDGLGWETVATDSVLGGPGDQEVVTVSPWGTGFVAVGTEQVGSDVNAAVWTSPDGTTWARTSPTSLGMSALTGIGRQEVSDLVPFGEMLIAVGREGRGEHDDAAVWIATTSGQL